MIDFKSSWIILFVLFSSELKRRLKAEQKAKEKEEKEATKAATQPAAGASKKAVEDEEEIDPTVNF